MGRINRPLHFFFLTSVYLPSQFEINLSSLIRYEGNKINNFLVLSESLLEVKLSNDFVTFPFIENRCISQDEERTPFSEGQNLLENKSSQPERYV